MASCLEIGFMVYILLLITLKSLASRQLFRLNPTESQNEILILIYIVYVILSKTHFWNLSVGAALLFSILKLLLLLFLLFYSFYFRLYLFSILNSSILSGFSSELENKSLILLHKSTRISKTTEVVIKISSTNSQRTYSTTKRKKYF